MDVVRKLQEAQHNLDLMRKDETPLTPCSSEDCEIKVYLDIITGYYTGHPYQRYTLQSYEMSFDAE